MMKAKQFFKAFFWGVLDKYQISFSKKDQVKMLTASETTRFISPQPDGSRRVNNSLTKKVQVLQ